MNSDTQIGGLLATPEQDGLTSLIIPGADDSRATGGLLSGSPLVQPLGGGPAGSSAQDTQPEALYPSLPFPDAPSSARQPDADEERQKRLELFLQIPLYDEDASVRKAVDDSPEFRIYGGAQKTLRSPGAYHIYGKDLARLVAPDMLNNPLELVQRTIAGVDDEVERSSWQKELDALMTSGKDDARSYWGLFGKMTWQKVQGEYARYREEQRRQQELYDENQYRVNGLVQRAIDGFEVEPTPEDMQLIREAGVDWQEVAACSKAMRMLGYPYGAKGFDAAITSETARKVYGVIKDHPQARQLLMQQLAEIGRHNDAGAVASLLEGVLSFGENVKETLNHYDLAEVLPQSEGTLRDSLHQKGLEAVAAFLDDHPEMASNEALCNEIYMGPFRQYEENSAVAALWGEMKNAVETGRAENVDVLGQTMRDVGSGAAFMLRLMPFVRGFNLLAGPAGERQRAALKAYEANMDMADPAIGAQAGAYGLIDSAALLRAPAAVYGLLGRATLNTGLGARYALFAARPAGALAVNAARGTLDAAVIIPGAMGGLKALYDASPLVADERLNTGMEELASLQAQLSDPKYLVSMAANGILFSGVGVRHVRGRAAQGLQRYASYRVMRMNGLTERQCADIAKLPAQERMQAMEQAVRDNVQSDPEANLRRSIDACRAELNRRQAQEMRADNAVQAALEARGYSLRESEQEGKVWMFTDGRMNPDGSFSPGEKKVLMTQEDADVFVQVIMRRELEATASAMRKEAGKMRLLDAFTSNLKGNARVRIMPRPETLEGLNRKAAQADERAVARSRELMSENEGLSEAEARARALDEVHPDIDDRPLGEVIQTAHDLGARLELERARGGSGDGTRAYVTTRRRPDGQVAERVLRIALDDRRLTMHEVAEELGEQIAKDWMESNGMDYADAYRTLRELQQTMEAHPDKDVRDSAGRFLSLKRLNEALEARLMGERKESASDLTPEEEAQVRSEVVEAISKLMRSDLISSASDMQGEFPAWARELFDTTTLTMAELPQQVAMAHALATARAEGWMPEAARTLLGVAPKAVEDALRRQAEPTVEEYRRDWFNMQRRQAELDAAFGEGVLRDPAETERFEQGCVDGQEAREQARASEQDAGFAEAREHVNELEKESPGMSHEEAVKTAAEKAADAKETEIEADPAAQQDAAFSGGRYVEIPDEGGHAVKAGMLPVDKLEVLPNFKLGADPQTGVVHPLTGDYYSTHDPIRAMRMKDGRIVVFSGRHRLDACRRAGVSRIMAYLYEEAADRGEAWMRRYDIESNIRDNQASPLEVALYVRGEFTEGRALSDEEAARAGIDRTGSLGAMGYRIGRNAGSSVIDALRNGRIDDRTALWIADFCPGNDAVQRRGLERAMDGASKGEILARMEAELALKSMQNELGIEGTTDLFGNAIDNDGFMDFVAQYVNRKRNELSKDIAYLRTNAGKRNSQAMAEKYGIKVGDAEGLKRQLTEMQALQDRWKNPYTDEALMGEIREAWRAENEGQQIAASRKESQSLSVLDSYFASLKGVKTESEFSTFDDSNYVSDKDGNKVPIQDLVKQAKELNSQILADMRASGRHNAVLDNIEKALAGTLKKAFYYRDLTAKEIQIFKEVLNMDFTGYAWQMVPSSLLALKKQKPRGKFAFTLENDDIMVLPRLIDDIAETPDVSISSNVKDIEPGGVVFVTVKNPLANTEMNFQIAPKIGMQKNRDKSEDEKKPKLTLTSAQAFMRQRAGLAPAQPPKSVPSSEAKFSKTAGEVKRNLLKQEFSSRDTSINKTKVPAVYKMVKETEGWSKGTVNIDIGGGKYDTLTNALQADGVESFIYEPYGRTSNENAYILAQLQSKTLLGDTATCSNVLNVIKESAVRSNVIHQVAKSIKPEGTAYFTIYEAKGNGIGAVSKNDCWQNNRKAETYVDEIAQYFGEVSMKGKLIIARNPLHTDEKAVWRRGGDDSTEIDFSIAGMKARCASEYIGRGEDYIDKADGQRKFVIPNTEARLSTGFTMGQLNPPEGGHKDVSLPALLHHPELYRNYPELAEMRVRLYNPTVDDSCYGFFHPKTDDSAAFIALNMKHCKGDAAQVLSTLLHESQHAIQTMEGFSVGAGVFDRGLALRYLDRAMELRKKLGVRDEWSQMNMRYMKFLHKLVSVGDKEALMAVYYHSRGEQEARFTGDGKGEAGENPTIGGKLTDGLPDSTTIAVTRDATELGGVTFLNMGRFGHLLDSRLNPGGEFNYDRAIYQMKENVIRRMRELKGLAEPGEAEGLRLAAEGLATMDSIEALLPNTYRYALEPYKLYFNTFAKLRGTGDAAAAASTVPMKGWDVRMYKAFRNSVWRLITETNEPLGEFWEHAFSEIPGAREGLEGMREYWLEVSEVVKAEYAERLADAPTAKERRRVRAKMMEEAHTRVELAYGEEMMKLYQALGSMRADKLMAKFLERVALQLDNFRKDKTLGRIRRVVDSLSPAPGKDGKPVKGRMDADSYRRVMDFVKLLELTRGERDRFFRTRYTGEEGTGEKAWAELEPNDKISVEVFDEDGKPMMLTCSKGEFEAYACYDAMTAAQAEAASRALGEFISTGKQAWENAEDAAKQRIAARCAPLMEAYDESINEYDERQNKRQRGVFSGGRKMLELLGWTMNDVQFFDALTGVPEIAAWAREFSDRIASAHVYMESNEKLRQGFLLGVLAKAAGTDKPKKVRAFLDEINRTQDTGVRLVPREPDFLGQEMATVRRQFLGLLHRKTHEKNFRPNNFAEALRTLTEKGHEIIPEDIAKEALAKYGTLGDAKKAVLKGEQAVMSLLTERERERFSNLTKTARSRAKEAREKWQESDKGVRVEQGVSDAESGETRRMSRAQAAYHVLMTEQADYAEMLRQQGYDEAAVAKLREFAGEDVMQLAYDLRDELGARTEQVKDMYERVYGMPFPEVENYFRAFFDVGYEQKENTVLDNQGYGSAAGGGAAKILYTRQHHNQSIDPTMNVLNAFALAMKQQDVLLGYGELPSDVMRVLNYKEDNHRSMAHALSLKIGDHALREMREHAINMTRLIPETEAVAGKLAIALNRLSSASAVTILNYRMGSLMKQGTALFNSFAGSDMVTAWEWDKSAARVTAGLGKISLKEMAARPELASRFKGWAAGADAAAQRALRDVKVSHGATDAKILGGMTLMEWVDVRANVRSSAILYDAVYRKLEKASPDMTPAQLDEAAMTEVRRALALKSQPLDWRSRSLMATKRSVFKMGSLFLGGESINTFGNVARLLARGKRGDWRRAAGVWIRHGVALQALTFLYNFLTDDEDMWERRSAYGYLTGSLLGPLMGIPFVSQVVSGAIGGVNHFLPKEYRAWMPTGSMLPMGDIERTLRDWKKWDKGSWQDRGIIVENTIRALAGIGAAIFSEPTTAGGARVKAASYATAAASNLIDFLLRGSRAVDERL